MKTDGSEDGEIHWIKAGQMAMDATATISAETARLNAGMRENNSDDDPFTSNAELEENEAAIDDNKTNPVTGKISNSNLAWLTIIVVVTCLCYTVLGDWSCDSS